MQLRAWMPMVCSISIRCERSGLDMAFLDQLLEEIEPYRQRCIQHPLLQAIETGSLNWDQLRVFGQYMYHFLIEAELRYSSISVVRSPDLAHPALYDWARDGTTRTHGGASWLLLLAHAFRYHRPSD